ncbi:hypothetical protein [Myxococcus xanthus]|uniref:hypothetical protein n=1 Tax=Myxococcus xanthus TaxID=34 RepID=UPI0011265143|nr:hypothetical protein [Myxococcus xanthus]QDE83317.1 hypothetical protein BHS07_18105 [Myxococcus xanthus]
MPVSLSLPAMPEEAAAILAAASLTGLTPARLIEHASVDCGGLPVAARTAAIKPLSMTMKTEMGEAEYATAVSTAHHLGMPTERFIVGAALWYIRYLKASHPAEAPIQGVHVPAA